MHITVDPRLKYNYASWYLLGLQQIGGSIEYNVMPFVGLSYKDTPDYNSGFGFIIKEGNVTKKVFVDTEDVAKVFKDRYEWCDVYGMVNPTEEQVRQYDKLIPIGPECGITLGSQLATVLKCVRLYLKGAKYTNIPFKTCLKDYLYTNIRRRPISDYENSIIVRKNYIFHASTLWYNEFAATDTNKYRGEFLKACQRAGLEIEGGLFYVGGEAVLKEMPDYPKYKEEYKDFIYDKRLSMDDYITKTKESVVVFNTPSVCGCHGWKLAEYLCMGKAIISTPLLREMPAPMEHGKHIHFVHSVDEIYDAVVKINTDETYRKQLEEGARAYYEQWLAPEVVVKRLIDKAKDKMKILQVITSMHIGGAEKVVMELILGLRTLGYDVDVALFSGEDTDFKRQLDRSGCRVFSFSIGGKTYNPIYILKLWRIMHRYDIVHTHNTAPQFFAAIAGLGSKAKLITTEHSSSNRRREKGHLKWFDNWLYGRYDTIVCIADQAKQAMETYLGRRMDDVAVINNGVNVEDFHSAEPASELYPHCGKFVIAMVAGFRYEKDQDTVIKAMTNLTDGYELWLVGDGVRRKELETLIETEGVKDRVKLLGIRKDVSNILHAADVVIMSSHREGLSLSNIEGMSVGKPFIASDVDGLREVTQNYGILFPHKDAIALAKIIDRLHTDKDYYHTVADRCYKRALEFDVNKMVEGYIDIYRSLI